MSPKVVLIGAGSANFGLGTLGDLLNSKFFAGSTICLHDINPTALQRVYDLGSQFIKARTLPFELTATTDRKQALAGATFCIISIEVGNRFELWDQDWQIPLQYGIRQVYGENGGPGGLFHSLRIIPPILEICADIMDICPDAWVFNFSNPMSRICTTVHRKYPELKLVGLCHEIASLPWHLPQILNTPLENLDFQAGGLNHFSILVKIIYKDSGIDAYPDVRSKAPGYFENERFLLDWAIGDEPAEYKETFIAKYWAERGLFKVILEIFGVLPITSDSHIGEYVPWAYDVVDHQGILDFYRAYQVWTRKQISEGRLLEGSGESWDVIGMLEAILTGTKIDLLAVNVPNRGFIENLPADIVVEVPGYADKLGVHGIALGKLPRGFGGLLLNQYAVHDLTADAIIHKSKEAALQALLVDPVVNNYHAAEQTLETMLAIQKKYLGYLK
jgi:alpha-galactosidase